MILLPVIDWSDHIVLCLFLVFFPQLIFKHNWDDAVLCCAKLLQSCPTLWTVACQAPLSMGFSKQEYWDGLSFPPPGNLPDPGIQPASLKSLTLAGEFFTTSATWEAHAHNFNFLSCFFSAYIVISNFHVITNAL